MTDILFYILCVFIAAAGGLALYLAYVLGCILIAFIRMCDGDEKDNNDTEGG